MNFYEPQTLIVVYRDELHVNQLKKLVETKIEEGKHAIEELKTQSASKTNKPKKLDK